MESNCIVFCIPDIILIEFKLSKNNIFMEIKYQNTDILKRGKYRFTSTDGSLFIASMLLPQLTSYGNRLCIYLYGTSETRGFTPFISFLTCEEAEKFFLSLEEKLLPWKKSFEECNMDFSYF